MNNDRVQQVEFSVIDKNIDVSIDANYSEKYTQVDPSNIIRSCILHYLDNRFYYRKICKIIWNLARCIQQLE